MLKPDYNDSGNYPLSLRNISHLLCQYIYVIISYHSSQKHSKKQKQKAPKDISMRISAHPHLHLTSSKAAPIKDVGKIVVQRKDRDVKE